MASVTTPDAIAVHAARARDALTAARDRVLAVLEPVPDADQSRPVSPLMSPLCWDLAHIAHFEELWLVRALGAAAPTDERFDDLYDAFRHPRAERATLPILGPDEARRFAASVRARSLDVLGHLIDDPEQWTSTRLLRDGFVFGMVAQHEEQHLETMLATIQLMGDDFTHPLALRSPQVPRSDVRPATTEIAVPGGRYRLGTDDEPWAYDNERPARRVDVAPFHLDAHPVTNAQYGEFVAAGGYDDERLWSEAGWAWRHDAQLTHPQYWRPEGDGAWSRLRFGHREDLPPHEPVQHVCWYEADACARWMGKRLPTETEWEVAASATPGTGTAWTPAQAVLASPGFGPEPVGLRPAGASHHGVHDLIGNVWEWTSSTFDAPPGFEAFPYREYSEVFFGPDYTVLRGGSWATAPVAIRATFRNWDFPIRRQIFVGFRCARTD